MFGYLYYKTRQKYQVRFFFFFCSVDSFASVCNHVNRFICLYFLYLYIICIYLYIFRFIFSLSFPLWCIWLIWFWGNESRFSTLARLARFIALILHLREEMYHVRPVLMHQIIYFNAKTSLALIKSIFYE